MFLCFKYTFLYSNIFAKVSVGCMSPEPRDRVVYLFSVSPYDWKDSSIQDG